MNCNTLRVIERTSQYLPGRGIFTKEPKYESRRSFALPQNVMGLLRLYRAERNKHKLQLGSLWQGSNRLFTTWNGRPGHPSWPRKWLSVFLKNSGLPHCSFHSLRHLNATISIKAGIPLKNISARLGHADIGTTANIYAEALKSIDREVADKLGDLLENKLIK